MSILHGCSHSWLNIGMACIEFTIHVVDLYS